MRNPFKKYGHFKQPYFDNLKFQKFIEEFQKQICINMGLPKEVILSKYNSKMKWLGIPPSKIDPNKK